MKVFIAYGCKADQIIALRVQALAAASGVTTSVPAIGIDNVILVSIENCDAVLAIADAGIDERFAQILKSAYGVNNKPIFCAGAQNIPPNIVEDFSRALPLSNEQYRVMTALRDLASAMCQLREAAKQCE